MKKVKIVGGLAIIFLVAGLVVELTHPVLSETWVGLGGFLYVVGVLGVIYSTLSLLVESKFKKTEDGK